MASDVGDGNIATKKAFRKEKQKDRHSESMPEDEEPDFSDPESFVDNVSDAELLGDFLKSRPKETDGIDSVVVVDNIPQVGPDRMEKLLNIIRKIFSKFGKIVNEFFPMDNGVTKGYIFLEFQSHQEALEAVKATDGYKLDKQHTFAVNLFSDFDKYANIPDNWEQPTPQPFKDHGNLYHWLLNPHCYDQFSVIFDQGEKTAIYQNMAGEPLQLEMRDRWTETYVRWSPRGTYLLTFHQKGVALWGGENMKQIMRFIHPGVQLSDFSPCERYLVTFSPLPDNTDDPQAIIIWDIRTGLKKRGFHCENAPAWPVFKWSSDGRYFARMSQDQLSIYETPLFGLLEKKSLKIKLLKDFSWSPVDNIISYWTSEERETPARVTLIEIPSRQTLCVKNLFTVADCKMHWQKAGNYLCVKVDRYKSKKDDKYVGISHSFNIFRIKEKEIPVDTIEIKDSISAFAWEPVGHRFAFIHGDAPRICASFYNVKMGATVELIKTLEKRTVNSLFWSPAGQFIVLAGLRSMNGILEFVDTNDMTIMMQAEHFMATDVEWDPTGRYVATAISWWGHKVDNAFWIWNFQGKLLHKQPLEKFCQLLWRPRPPTLLSSDELKEIKKNMKTYYNTKFSVEDKMRESKASKEQIERRRNQMAEYNAWKKMCEDRYAKERSMRIGLRNGVDTENPSDASNEFCAEETVEFLINVEEIIIDDE